jgi:hypothetical protein
MVVRECMHLGFHNLNFPKQMSAECQVCFDTKMLTDTTGAGCTHPATVCMDCLRKVCDLNLSYVELSFLIFFEHR